jgi:hypothetical protein
VFQRRFPYQKMWMAADRLSAALSVPSLTGSRKAAQIDAKTSACFLIKPCSGGSPVVSSIISTNQIAHFSHRFVLTGN